MIRLRNIVIKEKKCKFKIDGDVLFTEHMVFIHSNEYALQQLFLQKNGLIVEDGEFYIDDILIYPLEKSDYHYLNVFDFQVDSFFSVQLYSFSNSLVQSRRNRQKIKSIFQNQNEKIGNKNDLTYFLVDFTKKINELSLIGYLLINFNDSQNDQSIFNKLQSNDVVQNQLSFPIFVIEKNVDSNLTSNLESLNDDLNLNDNSYYFIVVGAEKDEEEDSSKSQNTKGKNAKLFAKHVFQSAKKNWSSILLVLFSSFLMVLFSSLIIYSFKNNELLDSVLILIISIVFFGISGFIYISCFDFLLTKSNDNKKRILTVLVIIEPILILAAGIGYLCLYLFYLSNFLVIKEQFNFVDIYPSFIFLAVMMLLPLTAKPMNILFAKIGKLFSKKKN